MARWAPKLVAAAGHLAAWVGLYFVGGYLSAAALLGRGVLAPAMAASFCAGVGLYLLDRVKAGDRWLDPADAEGQPVRHRFLLGHRRIVRMLAWATLALGAVAAAAIEPANLLLPPVGVAGVLLYGSVRRGRNRPKDVILLKNLAPASAIAGLSLILAFESPARGAAPPPRAWALVGTGLLLAVLADAMLCDLDDIDADRRSATGTVPVRFGARLAWNAALALHGLAGGAVLAAGGPPEVACAWAVAGVALTSFLRLLRPAQLRDLVDLKLPAVALITWLFV